MGSISLLEVKHGGGQEKTGSEKALSRKRSAEDRERVGFTLERRVVGDGLPRGRVS